MVEEGSRNICHTFLQRNVKSLSLLTRAVNLVSILVYYLSMRGLIGSFNLPGAERFIRGSAVRQVGRPLASAAKPPLGPQAGGDGHGRRRRGRLRHRRPRLHGGERSLEG